MCENYPKILRILFSLGAGAFLDMKKNDPKILRILFSFMAHRSLPVHQRELSQILRILFSLIARRSLDIKENYPKSCASCSQAWHAQESGHERELSQNPAHPVLVVVVLSCLSPKRSVGAKAPY